MELANTINDCINSFKQSIQQAENHLIDAAMIYVKAVNEHGDKARAAFQNAIPDAPMVFWRRIEGVGRGNIDKRLVLERHVGASFLEKLPVHVQADTLNNGVKVLTGDGDHLLVRIENMTRHQCRMVFSGDHIRSLNEQRAWLESNNQQHPRVKVSKPYEIKGSKVTFNQPLTLNKSDLISLLAQMK